MKRKQKIINPMKDFTYRSLKFWNLTESRFLKIEGRIYNLEISLRGIPGKQRRKSFRNKNLALFFDSNSIPPYRQYLKGKCQRERIYAYFPGFPGQNEAARVFPRKKHATKVS